jgi:hypothetical protein
MGMSSLAGQINLVFETSVNEDAVRLILANHSQPPDVAGPSFG